MTGINILKVWLLLYREELYVFVCSTYCHRPCFSQKVHEFLSVFDKTTNLVDFEQLKFYKLTPEELLTLFKFCLLSFQNIIHLFDIPSHLPNLYFYNNGSLCLVVEKMCKLSYLAFLIFF